MADRKRPPVVIFILPLFVGLIGLFNVTRSPQFESYRTLHVVQLLASGACFGAAIAGLIVWLLRPRA
jgi:hypothetical protein